MYTKLDTKIESLGFVKLENEEPEDEFGASYRREKYTQRVDILRIPEGNHIVTSYEEKMNSEDRNNVIGLTYEEMVLFAKKLKEMKKKYKWE